MSDPKPTPIRSRQRAAEARRQAQSRYGQVRLTVTFEPSGRLSYRAMAKRPEDDWKELHCFAQGSHHLDEYPPTFDDALEMFGELAGLLRWLPERL